MPNLTHKFFSIYSKAESDTFANTDLNLFYATNYSSPNFQTGTDAETSGTFDENAGEITISAGGQYHALISLNCDGTGGFAFDTIKILVNGTERYGSLFVTDFDNYSGGGERTFSTILSLNDNDVVKVVINTNDDLVGIYVKPGTTFSLISMDSAYGINTRTADDTKNATEHNPFQSGTFSTSYSSGFSTVSGGIGYNDSGWQSTYGNSPTFALASYQPIIGDDQNIVYKLYKNASTSVEYTAYSFSGEVGYERTIPVIFSLSSSNYVKPTMYASTGDGAYLNSGSSFSLDRIRETAYLSKVFSNQTNTITTNGNYLSFLDQDSYASYAATDLATPADISHDSTTGNITINTAGYYLVAYTMILSASTSDAAITNSIRTNSTSNSDGTLIYETAYTIDTDSQGTERTIFGIFQFSQNDTVQFWTTKTSGGSIKQVYGVLSMFLVDEGSGGGGGGGYGESEGLPSYDSNYVINTYSKSNQHSRYIEQIPFGIQIPGPLSLRNRIDTAIYKGKKSK